MRGDFTRDTFDPARHFSRVLMQQGRVQLDADWNEQTAILLHYLRTLAKDILGPYAGPADAMGFEIITSETPNWEIRIDSFEPDKTRQSALKAAINKGNAVIAPGRYYVHGILVESERTVLYDEQPVYALGGTSTIDELKSRHGLLFYLDVWERHITYVEDDRIREVALGGVDTCSRAQIAWQVRVLPQDYGEGRLNCESVNTLYRADPGKLRARARLEKPPTERCVISPESRYRGMENQLYRVEVHLGGTVKNEATFKWSRENGSVIFPIRSLSSSAAPLECTATLAHLGRDSRRGLKPGDWVEIVDEWIAMGEKAGPLARVEQVNRDDLSVALKLPGGSTNLFEYTEIDAVRKRPLLRRWDHSGDAKFGGALRIVEQDDTAGRKSGWISVEHGVQISFAKGGNYRAGDFWLIPARVATGDVEWPPELNASGTPKLLEDQPVPAAQAPHGPRHYYAPLLLRSGGQTTDCRCRIKPLQYLHPGVYIEEIDKGPRPITGVPTSTAAFIGETERGLTKPRVVTSYKDFVQWFGGVFADKKFMPYAVNGFFENGGQRLYVCRVASAAATTAEAVFGDFVIKAAGPGLWGKRVYVKVDDSSTQKPGPDNTMVPVGVRLRAAYYNAQPNGDPVDWFTDPKQPPLPSAFETFDDLDADEQSPNYWYTRLNDNSALVEVTRTSGPIDALPAKQFAQLATNGSDGNPPDVDDFEGDVQLPQRSAPQGLAALKLSPYDDVALVYAPDAPIAVAQKVIAHCENLKYRLAVIDIDKGVNAPDFEPRRAIKDTKYAAVYYPWLVVSDPQTGMRKEVPPGGHVLGVFARTDLERGVVKAPANETLRGVVDLTAEVDDQLQDILNPRGVNTIRKFSERGIRVWGARTLTSDALWKYVSVRRLFIFLERSIYEGTQWVVFEPNDDRLWTRVIDTIRLFLRSQWRLGALFGRTEQEAFFITCDRTTMTQDDILNGRLICEIGVAPVRPAEFVIFRIFQNTAEAQT